MAEMQIADGKVATFHYTLRNGDSSGDVLDSSDGREPLAYLHGAGNIVPGLEQELSGKQVGDKFDAVVPPAEGYGVREGAPQPVDRSAFPEGVSVTAGMMFQAQTPDGEIVPLWVDRVDESTVWVDENHPLAGVTLHFAIEVVGVREATAVELEHGHPHGPGGQEH